MKKIRKNKAPSRTDLLSALPPYPVKEASPEEGLTEEEARARAEYGLSNTPVESPTKTEKEIILHHSLTFFNFIFVFLAACLIAVGSYKDMLFLLIAIANTLIGIFQEIRSKHHR